MRRMTLCCTAVTVLVLSTLLAASPGPVQATPGQDKTKPPPATRQASCLLRISSEIDTLVLDEKTIYALATSTGVLQGAVQEVLGAQSGNLDEIITVSFARVSPGAVRAGARGSGTGRPVREQAFIGKLELDIFDEAVKPAATELLERVCDRLVTEVGSMLKPERDRLVGQLERARDELDRAKRRFAELQMVQAELRQAAGSTELSREAILETVQDLEQEVRSLEMVQVAKRARADALAEQVAKIGAQVEAGSKSDEVAAELERIVDLRKQEFVRVQSLAEKELASEPELGRALEQVALAKVELARHRQELAKAAGGELMAELNGELIMLAIDTAEMEASLAYVQSRLQEAKDKKLLELADRYEREVALEFPLARHAVESATMDRDELETQLRNFREPTVTVIGGK